MTAWMIEAEPQATVVLLELHLNRRDAHEIGR